MTATTALPSVLPLPAPALPDRAALLAGLLALAEQTMALTDRVLTGAPVTDQMTTTPAIPDTAGTGATMDDDAEPAHTGLYRDRDGDIWEKTAVGWKLYLQRGVPVDPASIWEWLDGHVRDYAPFVRLAPA